MTRFYRLERISNLERARELLDSGRPADALRLLRVPLPTALSRERDFLIAESLRAQGYFKRCEPYYLKILRGDVEKDRALWLDSCLGLASVKRSLGETDTARQLISKGIAVAKKVELTDYNRRLELESVLIDRAQGRYSQSLFRLRKFPGIFRSRKDWSGVGFVLWAMGGSRRFSGDLKGAQRDFLSALVAFKRAQDGEGKAYALFGLGGVCRIRGLLKESQKYYAMAQKSLEGSQDIFAQAYAHCGLANVLRQRGDYERARSHYLRSYKLYFKLQDRVDLAYVDWGLGKLALHNGRLAQAQVYFYRALAVFKRSHEKRGEVLSTSSLAQVLHARGRTSEAQALFEKSWKTARASGLHAHLEIFT